MFLKNFKWNSCGFILYARNFKWNSCGFILYAWNFKWNSCGFILYVWNFKWNSCGFILYAWNFKWNSCGFILYMRGILNEILAVLFYMRGILNVILAVLFYMRGILICSFNKWLYSCRRLNKYKEANFLFHFWFLLSFLTWHICFIVNCCQRPLYYLRRTYIPRLRRYISDRKIRVWREWSVFFF